MYPILFHLGNFTIYTYGLMVALGFVFAVLYISRALKKSGSNMLSQDNLYNLCILIAISAVAGARLAYELVENFQGFISNPLDFFKVWEGGLVFYGGLIAAVLSFIIYVKVKKIPFFKLADIFAPAIALGHFFGRLGCFFAGCCFGKCTTEPWSVVFNNPNTLAIPGQHLHPTQLYDAFGNLILFFLLNAYNKKTNRKDGSTFAFYLFGYAILRFIVEFYRADYRGGSFLGLSASQLISILLLISGLIILYYSKTKVSSR